MTRYPAIIDGSAGAYGITFPDLDGIVAMGETIDQAILNAEEALRDYAIEAAKDDAELCPPSAPEAIETSHGTTLVSIPLIRSSGKPARANMVLDVGVLSFIDAEATRRGMTRTKYVEWMTRRIAQMGG